MLTRVPRGSGLHVCLGVFGVCLGVFGCVWVCTCLWVRGGYEAQGQVPGMHHHTCMRPRRAIPILFKASVLRFVECKLGGGVGDHTGYGKVCKDNRTGHAKEQPTSANAVASVQRGQGFVTNVHWAMLVTSGA
jgi:hypothetical protein